MQFKDLYTLSLQLMTDRLDAGAFKPASLYELRPHIIDGVTWLDGINIYPVEAKDGDPYGHIEFFGNQESRWEDPDAWTALITYNSDLNMCRRRFVCFKEAMHILIAKTRLPAQKKSISSLCPILKRAQASHRLPISVRSSLNGWPS